MAKTKVREENPYSYLYDKCFKLSSRVNHDKALFRAKVFGSVYKSRPIFENMFSDLKAFPRTEVFNENRKVIPPWFLKDYSDYIKKISSYLLRYTELDCNVANLKHLIPENLKTSIHPSHVDRWKFSINPIIPKTAVLPPDVMLATIKTKRAYYLKRMKEVIQATRTIGTQTIYRDSAVQTDPYSPEFLLRPGAEPEILTLIPLSYKFGLPAGLHEIKMIERARQYRKVEGMYPNLIDIGEARKRRAALNNLEIEEWKIRECQIDELQMLRLEVIMKLMRERKEYLENVRNESLERVCRERIKNREEKQNIVYYEFIKGIRKILKSRLKKGDDRSLIDRYGNPASITWAPLTRIGQFLDQGSQRYVVDNNYLTTFDGLCDLDNSLPSFVTNPTIRIPMPKHYTKDGFKNKKFRLEEELAELYKFIKTKKQIMQKEKRRPLRFLSKNEKLITRPPTPTLDFEDTEYTDFDFAMQFLSQLVKGRAIQVMMYEGKEKRIQLIKEIQSTHALHKEEMEIKKHEKYIILAHQRTQMLFENKESTIYEVIETFEGQSLGDISDFLGKELIRLQEERRLHAFAMMALRERRLREAEESGLRQLEERRRREEDEIFKQIVKVHQTTVETYMEDIISENIDLTAEGVARRDIEEMAEKINNIAYETEKNRDYLLTEEIVSDLVHHFLIPEVYKSEARDRIKLNQRKYLLQAHRAIVEATERAVNPNAPVVSPTTQETSKATETDAQVDTSVDPKEERGEEQGEEQQHE